LSMIRAFVALDLPYELKGTLAAAVERLTERNRGVRWVRPEGMHLTLKFLGDIPETDVQPIAGDLDVAAGPCSPLRLRLSGFGAFPGPKKARVVWVGVSGDTEALGSLAKRVDEACASHGIPRERRPFAGHITLGRLRVPSVVDLRVEPVQGAFVAEEIVLYRSELSPGGARYTPLHKSRLKGTGG